MSSSPQLYVAVYVDRISGEHGGKTDVHTSFTDGETDLVRVKEYLCLAVFFVKTDRGNLGGTKRARCM